MLLSILNRKSAKDTFNEIWKKVEEFEEKRQYLHQLIVHIACNNELFISPINPDIYNKDQVNNYKLVLNLGSGYRIWSIYMSQLYNNLIIIDIDIINYNEKICEPLIIFDNIDLKNDKISRIDNSVDFIYQRDMISVYENDEWDILINEIYRILKNKAFVELVEYDFIIEHKIKNKCVFTNIVVSYLIEMFKKNNHIYEVEKIYHKLKKNFNPLKINIMKIELPLYVENKFEGICIDNLILGIKHIEKSLENITKKSFDEIIENLKKEWRINKSYMKLYIIYAQK